jgi:hypothetical protein
MADDDAPVIAVADPAEHWDLTDLLYKSSAGRLPMKTEIEPFYQKKRRIIARRFCGLPRNAGKRAGHRCGSRSTPDHQHAHGILIAMRMGKPVDGEKPLIPTIARRASSRRWQMKRAWPPRWAIWGTRAVSWRTR